MQLPYIQKIIHSFQFPSLRLEGYGPTTWICGSLVHRARAVGFQVEIITGDKALTALAQEGVDKWDPMKEVRYYPAAIRERSTASTRRNSSRCGPWPGDASDNIPGCGYW